MNTCRLSLENYHKPFKGHRGSFTENFISWYAFTSWHLRLIIFWQYRQFERMLMKLKAPHRQVWNTNILCTKAYSLWCTFIFDNLQHNSIIYCRPVYDRLKSEQLLFSHFTMPYPNKNHTNLNDTQRRRRNQVIRDLQQASPLCPTKR